MGPKVRWDMRCQRLEDGMTEEQITFFNELKMIQDMAVEISLSNFEKYEKKEDILKDVTYEVICGIMELLDGYRNDSLKCNIVNVRTGKTINDHIEMHDLCEEFLEYAAY